MSIQYLVLLEGFQRAPWDATLGSTQRELDFQEYNDAADILELGVVTRKASQLCSTVKFCLRNWKFSFTDYHHPHFPKFKISKPELGSPHDGHVPIDTYSWRIVQACANLTPRERSATGQTILCIDSRMIGNRIVHCAKRMVRGWVSRRAGENGT